MRSKLKNKIYKCKIVLQQHRESMKPKEVLDETNSIRVALRNARQKLMESGQVKLYLERSANNQNFNSRNPTVKAT